MKHRILTISILLFLLCRIYGQQNSKWTVSGSAGIGYYKNHFSSYTGLETEYFIIKRLSLGLNLDHISTYKTENDGYIYINKDYLNFKDYYSQDLCSNIFSPNLFINFYLIKGKEDLFSVGSGIGLILNHSIDIRHIGIVPDVDPYVGIYKTKSQKFSYGVFKIDYTYLINDKVGFHFKSLISIVNKYYSFGVGCKAML
jgi:hypothetical protein